MAQNHFVKFPFRYLAVWGCGWPAVGISVCLLVSVLYHFDRVTSTHCKVPNVLPSISAAVGDVSPQKHIFRACIGLHCPAVYFGAFWYFKYFNNFSLSTFYCRLNYVTMILRWTEITALLGLSVISSTENHSAHEKSFILFVVTSYIHMIALLIMLRWSRRRPLTDQEKRSIVVKFTIFVLSLTAMLASAYFFFRHNAYCEPYIYSFYCGLEYVVVALNIAYHGSILMDMGRPMYIYVGPNSGSSGSDRMD
ncbi:post-GPI attachment to proteins factor 2-like [Corticium candelabrum]|uniref:post-GPI attachment to proteins factor 2-like n=1 Tax=Corticium candelabrum TaxID=121492 RepID=UPI002E2710B5|nr:post-GPI attachment to proteins factor 2-like [Corticium candelabrum]